MVDGTIDKYEAYTNEYASPAVTFFKGDISKNVQDMNISLE